MSYKTFVMNYKKKKKFVIAPKYAGGSKALDSFVKANLQYPPEALVNKIGGQVLVSYSVDDQGFVVEANVLNGIGFGCDSEALRLVKMLRYEAVKNRGINLITNMKIAINFNLPQTEIQINYSTSTDEKKIGLSKNKSIVYSYIVDL